MPGVPDKCRNYQSSPSIQHKHLKLSIPFMIFAPFPPPSWVSPQEWENKIQQTAEQLCPGNLNLPLATQGHQLWNVHLQLSVWFKHVPLGELPWSDCRSALMIRLGLQHLQPGCPPLLAFALVIPYILEFGKRSLICPKALCRAATSCVSYPCCKPRFCCVKHVFQCLCPVLDPSYYFKMYKQTP